MTRKNMLLGGVLAAVAFPGLALGNCLRPAEATAFDVRALQSQLMVVALSCQQHDAYNAFVTRFQPQLGQAHTQVTAHFRRVAGRQSQRAMDQYITNLANNHMQEGIRQGSHFCQNQMPLFQQAMQARDLNDLARISTQAGLAQPLTYGACLPAGQRQADARR